MIYLNQNQMSLPNKDMKDINFPKKGTLSNLKLSKF